MSDVGEFDDFFGLREPNKDKVDLTVLPPEEDFVSLLDFLDTEGHDDPVPLGGLGFVNEQQAAEKVAALLPKHAAGTTLSQIQAGILSHISDGTRCGACSRMLKIYPRSIGHIMAAGGIWLTAQFEENGGRYINVPDEGPKWMTGSNQHPTLAWWGLIERPPPGSLPRDDTKKHSGLWRPTAKGILFFKGQSAVKAKVLTWLGIPIGFDADAGEVTINQCHGAFDIRDVLGPTFAPRKPKK